MAPWNCCTFGLAGGCWGSSAFSASWARRAVDGRSLSVARDARVPAIYAEWGGGGRCNPSGVAAYVEGGGTMAVLSLIENEIPDGVGDHAAAIETSFMLYLYPELVDLARLHRGPAHDVDTSETIHNWMGAEYEDHPCYGLVGMDPRAHASSQLGERATERLLGYLAEWVQAH